MIRSALTLLLCSSPLVAEITFEPNRGQAGQNTRFVARGTNFRIDLADASSQLLLRNKKGAADLDLHLLDANRSAQWEAMDPRAGHSNYFHGQTASQWITDIPNFGKVREKSIYPGIDLVYYGNQNTLEYDFVVAPGADAGKIRMGYKGATSAHIDDSGNLIFNTGAGEVIQQKPAIYQNVDGHRKLVAGKFRLSRVLKENQISFEVGDYDHSLELTIDPTIAFASYIGGSGADQGNGIAVDSSGNLYIVGSTPSSNGDSNVLLRKFSASGAQIYMADLGGKSDDFGNAIRVGTDGSVYVGGRTSSSDFPTMNPSQSQNGGGADAFVLRMNAAGNGLIFSTYLGGNSDDYCSGLAIDGQGAIYLTGTAGGSFPATLGTFQTTNKGGLDAFVAKFDSTGKGVYSTLIGGGSDDQGNGIAVDTSGNAYATGTTLSDDFPQINNPFQHSRHGGVDAFAVEVNPTGTNLVYSSFFGGLFSDSGYAVAVDSSGAAYIAGKTASRDFPTTGTAFQKDYQGGDNDIFVLKLNPGTASIAYCTYIGSSGSDEGFGIAIDSNGSAYVTGDTDADNLPVTTNATQFRRGGNRDALLGVISPDGTSASYLTYLGGGNNDVGYGVALDTAGNAYIAGITSSTDFPVTPGAFQTQLGGGADAFFTKYQFSTVGGAPAINSGGIVNGASFGAGPVAPGSVISIFGTNFVSSAISATTVPLPTTLSSVSVLVNGAAVPLYYVGTNQINAQLPSGLSAGRANLQVNTPNGTTASTSFTVVQAAPYISIAGGRAVVTDASGNLITTSNPARAGSTVVVYFTGVGAVNAPVTDGAASPSSPLPSSALPNSATIGGANAPIAYIGLTPGSVALAQANLVIPAMLSGDVTVVITVNGVASNAALLAVSQ